MPLTKAASISTYGGAKNDYSAPVDSTTDRPAKGVNPAYGDVAAMSHTDFRAWAHLTLYANTAVAPKVVDHDEKWNNGVGNAAPVAARVSPGIWTVTYPTTVLDEIPATSPGYAGPQTLGLQYGIGNARAAVPTTGGYYDLKVFPIAANIVQLALWHQAPNGGMTLGDVAGWSSMDVDFSVR